MTRRVLSVLFLNSTVVLLAGGCGGRASNPSAKTAPKPAVAIVDPVKPIPKPIEPTKPKSSLVVEPASFAIDLGEPGIQFTARTTTEKAGVRDVTHGVDWSVRPSGLASIDNAGYLKPIMAGKAHVRASIRGEQTEVAVEISDPGLSRPIDFAQDVIPILTRAGCNTGGCHGRADGQNGFHLSLFGYDPEGDYQALTRQSGGRRFDPIDPARSLFIQKATGSVAHGGGRKIDKASNEYQVLLGWLRAGSPWQRGKTHGAMVGLDLIPTTIQLDEPGRLQVRVVARYADGHQRDVTRLASFRVLDDSALQIDGKGNAELARRAEVDLVARYQSKVTSARLATLINPNLKFDFKGRARRNFIDEELFKRLEAVKVPPSPPAGDAAFLRRVSLDLIGQQPDPQRIREFLADTDPEKRVKLVDRLLAHRDFVKFWQIKFGDMLQITSTRFGNGSGRYQMWLSKALLENRPWDSVVRELLTALGDPASPEGGPVNYALDGPDAKTQAEQTAQRFLALRLRCAQCHDHPFDIWTQDDYFGLAACFAKVQRPVAPPQPMMGRALVKVDPKGQVEHLRTRAPSLPRLLDGSAVDVEPEEDPRKALADWITRPDNPYFARAMANWTWAQFFGKGIADPADDLGRSNPPVHPELLDKLAQHFVDHKYDIRHLIRTIVTSEAYGISSATVAGNEHDTRFFSHQLPRPLTAYQMADTLAQVTDVINRYPNRAAGTRAVDVIDPSTASPILDTFGRCSRANGCAAVSNPTLSLRQALLLVGGDVVESKISNLNGYLANMLEITTEPTEIVENLYLRTLCRPPTEKESGYWSTELKKATSKRDASEDLFWALINSREFSFNH